MRDKGIVTESGPVGGKGTSTSKADAGERWHPLRIALGLLIVIVLAWAQPAILLDAGDYIGYAMCHQIPWRSFSILGRPLPLCARCTGTFLGAVLGVAFIFIRRRTRARSEPPVHIFATLLLFILFWAVDGFNSFLALLELPHLYEPSNPLRLITGMLCGMALSSLYWPVLSTTVWEQTEDERVIASFSELGTMLVTAGILVALVLWGWPPVMYLLSLASVLGVLMMLMLVNTIIAAIFLRVEGRAHAWRDLWLPAIVGAVLSAGLLAGMGFLRAAIERRAGPLF